MNTVNEGLCSATVRLTLKIDCRWRSDSKAIGQSSFNVNRTVALHSTDTHWVRGPWAGQNTGKLVGFATVHNDMLLLQFTRTLIALLLCRSAVHGAASQLYRVFGRLVGFLKFEILPAHTVRRINMRAYRANRQPLLIEIWPFCDFSRWRPFAILD